MLDYLQPADNSNLLLFVGLAVLVALAYLVARARQGRHEFKLIDAAILSALITILLATSIPLINEARARAQVTTLRQNLQTLRTQIERYKLEHNGMAPVIYQGGLPQMSRCTNSAGTPGHAGHRYPYGPYLPTGMPANPITGRSIVTPTYVFPPERASGAGGWLYHQPSGQIVPDLDAWLQL